MATQERMTRLAFAGAIVLYPVAELAPLVAASLGTIAVADNVQGSAKGPLAVIATAAGMTWLAIALRDRVRARLGLHDKERTDVPLLYMAAVLLPLLLSWAVNGRIGAMLTPLDYWQRELKAANESTCDFDVAMLRNGAEEAMVEHNKYQMGIATSASVRKAVAMVEVHRAALDRCTGQIEKRRQAALERLEEIGAAPRTPQH